MDVHDRHGTYVGQVYHNGDVHDRSGNRVGTVYHNGDVHNRSGYVGTVYANGKISGTTSGGHIYAEGSVNDADDRHVGKVSGINMFSSTEDRYYAGGAALLLLLQPTASSVSTPTSGSKEVFSTLGGRTVWKYTVNNAAEKMGAEEGIAGLKEWAVVKDVGVLFPPRTSWEIWVAGELKDTVFSEREALESMREFLSENTVQESRQQDASDRDRTTIPIAEPPVPPRGQKNSSFSGLLFGGGLVVALVVAIVAVQLFSHSALINSTTPNQTEGIGSATGTAVVSSQAPFGGKLVLDDPLRANSKGYEWDETTDSEGGACQFKDGAYHAITPQRNLKFCVANAPTFANFAFQVKMVLLSGGTLEGGGVMFREHVQGEHTIQDSNGYWRPLSYYAVLIRPINGSYLFLAVNNPTATNNPQEIVKTVKTLSSGSSSAIQKGLNQPNLIAVVARGSSLTLYINNQQVASVTDSSLSSGQIAVEASQVEDNSPVDVAFSDAKVWKL
jgi:hypothetical protein